MASDETQDPPADTGASVHDFQSGLGQLGGASSAPNPASTPREPAAPATAGLHDAGAGLSWDQLSKQSQRAMPKVRGAPVSVTGSVGDWYDRASPGLYRWSRAIVALPLLAASLTAAWRWTATLFEGFKRVGPEVDVSKVDPGKLVIPVIVLILAYWLAWVVANASWLMIAAPLQRAELTSRFLSGLHPVVTAAVVFLVGFWFYLGFTNSEKFENITVALVLPLFIAILVAMFQVRAGLRDGDMPAGKLDACLLICFTAVTVAGGMEVRDRLAGRGWYKEKGPDQRTVEGSTRNPPVGTGRTSREQESLNALTWEQLRAQRPTKLIRHERAPGITTTLQSMYNGRWRPIVFTSDNRTLQAIVTYPSSAQGKPRLPAILYCHGAYALDPREVEQVTQLLNHHGFIAMLPAWRGENGHGGNFEFLAGEVDDAVAAAKWLAQQPRVDPERIYAYGGSSGGALTALLSLTDAPLRLTASSSGLYSMDHIRAINRGLEPFDASDPIELRLRSLIPHIPQMKRRHLAYIGTEDRDLERSIPLANAGCPAYCLLEVHRVPGDNYTANIAAMTDFFKRIKADGK